MSIQPHDINGGLPDSDPRLMGEFLSVNDEMVSAGADSTEAHNSIDANRFSRFKRVFKGVGAFAVVAGGAIFVSDAVSAYVTEAPALSGAGVAGAITAVTGGVIMATTSERQPVGTGE